MNRNRAVDDRIALCVTVCGLCVLLAGCLPVQSGPRAGAATQAAISAEAFATDVRTLSSDAFEGREPASPGERKTVAWIRDRFEELGLEPGAAGSWFQEVPLVKITAAPDASLVIDGGATALDLASEHGFPNWYAGNEFRAIRDRSRAGLDGLRHEGRNAQ